MENMAQTKEESDSYEHVAGLAEQIAQAMLQDDHDENLPDSVRSSHVRTDAQRARVFRAQMSLSLTMQDRIEREALQLLYEERLRFKMDELSAAQQRLAYYGKASVSVAPKSSHLAVHEDSVPNMVSRSMSEQYPNFEGFNGQNFHEPSVSGRDWSSLRLNQCQTRQRLRADHTNFGFSRSTDSSGMREMIFSLPACRSSGGTGVFLPRSRGGSRPLHPRDTKQKPVLPRHMIQAPSLNIDNTALGAASAHVTNAGFRKELLLSASTRDGYASLSRAISKDVEDKPSFHHPSYSTMQEVAPNISLPTEWTY